MKASISLTLLLSLLCLNGCETLSFYQQAIGGHLSLLHRSKSINSYLTSAETPSALKARLREVLRIKEFAEQHLSLPVNQQYSHYVALDRPYVVWNVFAAPEFSLIPKTWCYPIAGCAGYRGYFTESKARAYADKLQQRGYDTYVAGIAAYSTLGWFKDPVLSSFLYRSDAELANLLYHELAHQLFYIKGDTVFNESFATLVANEGVKRWMAARATPADYAAFIADQGRQREFVGLVISYRDKLETLYASQSTKTHKRAEKRKLISELRQAYGVLKQNWNGISDYDHWFNQEINNAQLNTVATYFELMPALAQLLEQKGGDLDSFYQSCRLLGAMSSEERDAWLSNL